ncbi:MAG: MmgE/PrpD family protein [Acidaminococcales bacterium]|jgi:2-methylcitrate dehydratase PrpD|nr:MmgE/PrpD family protein [Acidaminococcales bacterium]
MIAYTKLLAEKIAGINYQDLSESTVQMAKQCVLDWLGNSIRGWGQKNMAIMSDALGQFPDGPATMFNGQRGAKNSVYYAALLNAAASHSLDFDDLHNASIIHLGCVVVPAAWAAAERGNLTGRDFLAAVVAGYEAGARIGECVNPESYHFWHTTATCGVFAAAAAAANLMKLGPDETVECLGSAGTQAAGLWEFLIDGAMSKTLHIGKAVFGGLLAAELTQKGFTGAKKILEGEKGFCLAMLPNPHWEALTRGGAGKYKIDENSFKPYACCKHTHPANYAAQLLRAGHGLALGDLETALIKTNSVAKSLVDNPEPQNPYGSKFSIQYCVAAMLKYGKLGVDEFSPENLADPAIRQAMRKFTVEVDPELEREFKERPERWSVDLAIRDKAGRVLHEFVEYPKGDPPNPMTWEESAEKFMALAEPVYGRGTCEKLCGFIGSLEKHGDFRQAAAACFA